MEQIYIRHVELLGFEKRFFPSQHYVYMLIVKWSDLSENLIYRRYPEIHTFHKTLKEMFPIESGAIEKRDRTIPSLPAPSWRDSQKATETRQSPLAEYCRSLINQPPHISRCRLVCSFFTVRPEDEIPPGPSTARESETIVVSRDKFKGTISEITGPIILDTYRVIGDYDKTSKHEITLHTGDLVEIAGGSASVKPSRAGFQPPTLSLWTPQRSLRKPNPTTQARELYITTTAYQAEQEDEVSLEVGEEVAVIHKLLDGWWEVRKGDEIGHFPSMFLQCANKKLSEPVLNNFQRRTPPPRRSTIRNAKSIHTRGRQRLSQEAYRRGSQRFSQKARGKLTEGGTKTPLWERKNQANLPEEPESSLEPKSQTPAVPLRPSADLIMQRCTEHTRKKVSIRKPNNSAEQP
ncbi:Neutrophil cytosolic factor 1 [Merluccius polli]|uniref:Neutrophil cytosolic factor 1 n=1 Tax=Merluccius polli TaxID=89951 RepID=A0AA47P1U9_MERPO|nr:Neutrophil cytosolic factor 1 [Merluccius polli]KAK0148770.1 Neutrophil cytosolic factor 1 [Merluccius polli]